MPVTGIRADEAGADAADPVVRNAKIHTGDGDQWLRYNGAGENLAWSPADFENFAEPRPQLPPTPALTSTPAPASCSKTDGASDSTPPAMKRSKPTSTYSRRSPPRRLATKGRRANADPDRLANWIAALSLATAGS